MYKQLEISEAVDSWIAEEELPASSCLKVIRANDPDFGLSEGEIDERNEFIRWFLSQEFVPLLRIPRREAEYDFFILDCSPASDEYSAFNTHDFQDRFGTFDKHAYAVKKVLERVKDLALMHSCVSSFEGREQVQHRYESVLEFEFRERLLGLVEQYRKARTEERRFALKKRIAEMNRRILEAKSIWEQCAPWDT
jgi:hypothetical protein